MKCACPKDEGILLELTIASRKGKRRKEILEAGVHKEFLLSSAWSGLDTSFHESYRWCWD
jgi:hypothetical protein